MQKYVATCLLIFTYLVINAAPTDYKNDWTKVQQFENEGLPQSAIKAVDLILQKAIKDKNHPQVIKSLVYRNKLARQIDRNDNLNIFADLNKLVSEFSDPCEKALLHSMLAELYTNYYQLNSQTISGRTNLSDTLPPDIETWSRNNFIDKIFDNLNLSIADASTLKKHTTKEFADIIEFGEDKTKYPTLYDFLMKRAIEVSQRLYTYNAEIKLNGITFEQLSYPATEYLNLNIKPEPDKLQMIFVYYQQYLKDLSERKLTSTIILTELDKIKFLDMVSSINKQERYLRLEKLYDGDEACAEIIHKLATTYTNKDSKYEWLKKGIEKYPNAYGTELLKEELAVMEIPDIKIEGKNVHHPDFPVLLSVAHKNIPKGVSLTLYKKEGDNFKEIKKYPWNTLSRKTYDFDTLQFDLGKLPFGSYSLSNLSAEELTRQSSILRFDFIVSKIFSFFWVTPEGEYKIYVADRVSGKPVKGADIIISPDNSTSKINLKTNENGIGTLKIDDTSRYRYGDYKVVSGVDSCLNTQMLRGMSYENFTENEYCSILLDRSIYRPGQTVYFKIVYIDKNYTPVANKNITAKLYNANREVVAEKQLRLNEFGSANGEFILPLTGLTGEYHIQTDNNAEYFSVEEYKRPTFEISFDKITETYSFGDEVRLKGYVRSFSGINLQNTDVKYSITREAYNFWRLRQTDMHFEDGIVRTGDDGSFEISFVPLAGTDKNYFFNIRASVTDVNGETQTNQQLIVVGSTSMVINIDAPEQFEKSENYKFNIEAKNLQGEKIETSGAYEIYELKDNTTEKVLSGNFKTGEQEDLKLKLKKLASGKYRIQVKAQDSNGKEVSAQSDFILFSYDDKKPPYETNDWFVEKNTVFRNGKDAELILGATDDIYVIYQISNNKKTFVHELIKLKGNRLFKIPYLEEYGDEVKVTFAFVKDAQLYIKESSLNKDETRNPNLTLSMSVFRDKLLPGQNETWSIKVMEGNNAAVAELLASMYDSSLDNLRSYSAWRLNVPEKEYIQDLIINNWYYEPINRRLLYSEQRQPGSKPNLLRFDRLNWFGYISQGYSIRGGVLYNIAVDVNKVYSVKSANEEAPIAMYETLPPAPPLAPYPAASVPAPVSIRKNFNETAFFYPELRTDKNGEAVITFTVPESNTTWRFRALAHDKTARTGMIEKMVVTRKELMVTPNMPRFLRQGDESQISTKISNLSDKPVSGQVYIEFFDPVTEKPVDIKVTSQNQQFKLAKDASASASWTFTVPPGIELIGCRIVAESEAFSDGEQHALTVLPNRMLVTESMPVDLYKAGTQIFTFDKLRNSTTLDKRKLTLEYASNPAWYAIQALPVMSAPSNENAVSWFASYYANMLGSSMVNQYPQVAKMIESWKKVGSEALTSKLEKNEELKAVLLEETPWVLEARNESEQMSRLALLFDPNRTKSLSSQATQKLSELQNPDGGWSWYKDMYSSRSITQYILYGYAKLQETGMIEYSDDIKKMQMLALQYIDGQIVKDFEKLKEQKDWEKTASVSLTHLEYAYVRSFYRDIPITAEAREAERFYTKIAVDNMTKLSLYGRSILTVLLSKNGEKAAASKIAASIREYAITNNSGMYWPNNSGNVFISMSSVCNHVFMMEALIETGATEEEISQMKRWLVKQKQTQEWESTHATIDAVGALLRNGQSWFTGETVMPRITVGTKLVKPENVELGTGYIKKTWDKSEIRAEQAQVKIEHTVNQPAFGAMYLQYFEDLDKITVQKGEALQVEKQLFIERMSATGPELTRITQDNMLKVGDKVVVRLVIKADRDFEFVHLKDMRAGCFEPRDTNSGVNWSGNLLYYRSIKDASTNFSFDYLRKGTHVLEYAVYVVRSGEYSNGITTIQCMYAPEFISHTQGIKVRVF